ncbi:uncharacterized protein KGF55_004020 [Candida pseudojiufengensis]|uniref:uncharacterized protein n=1 Tax=Candida pseudojiufengensis TaxID=497109 RepID=UPI00222454C2|nr:uncharacterized protein KGF55_004020 [Candida pseudojiufengensis]KAI5961397.1 hypothetical protein KGF55_004020 [Candida pseudojiufengensis]
MSKETPKHIGSLNKSFSKKFNDSSDEEFNFHLIQFGDKQILNISINGILDTTFKLPISTKRTIDYESMMDLNEDDDDQINENRFLPEPQLLIGDYSNMKISIIASQIGKIISLNYPKETILSIGSKWFGKGNEVNDDDFEKLSFIIENVKKLF